MFKKRRFIFLSVIGALAICFAVVRTNMGTSVESAYEQIRLLVDILEHVQTSYVEPVQMKDLIYGAASGIMQTLDPFSQFLPPEALNDMKVETEGEFGGIGIRVHIADDGWLTVITPLPGTPAFEAGVFPQDRIIRIDGESTEGITIQDAVKKLRGQPKSKVLIRIAREEKNERGESSVMEKDILLTREIIKIKTIDSRMIEGAPNVGYIRVTEFNAQTPRDMHTHLLKLKKQGMSSLVLDLRFNPGGLLPAAIETVKEFIGDYKLVVYTQGRRQDSRVEYRAGREAPFADLPMAVLINQGTASGSEIVAGALKDHKRAVIVGSRTFGKGSVQSVINLFDASGLRLTTAYYYTPSGRLIHKRAYRRKQSSAQRGPLEMKRDEKGESDPEKKKQKEKEEEEEHWGIDPDIKVEVMPEVAARVHSSFDLVYYPDDRPSKPIRDVFKKKETKPQDAREGEKESGAKKEEEPLRDAVLEKAVEVLRSGWNANKIP